MKHVLFNLQRIFSEWVQEMTKVLFIYHETHISFTGIYHSTAFSVAPTLYSLEIIYRNIEIQTQSQHREIHKLGLPFGDEFLNKISKEKGFYPSPSDKETLSADPHPCL